MENTITLREAQTVAARLGIKVEFVEDGGAEFIYLPKSNTVVLGTVGPTTAHCAVAFFRDALGIEVEPRCAARLALLHELGHAATWGNFNDAELFWEALCKDDPELPFSAYWCLPSERAANEWAAARGRELGWW